MYVAFSGDNSDVVPMTVDINGHTYTINQTMGYVSAYDMTIHTYSGAGGTLNMAGGDTYPVTGTLVTKPGPLFDGSWTVGTSSDPTMSAHRGYNSTAFAALGSYSAFGSINPTTGRDGLDIGMIDVAQISAGNAVLIIAVEGDRRSETAFHSTLLVGGEEWSYSNGYSSYDAAKDYTSFAYSRSGYTLPAWPDGTVLSIKF